MTREEAVNRFKGIRESFSISIAQSKFYPSKAELDELCDMAIEALSADAVSREGKENDKLNTCNNHSNNANADYKSHIRLIDANALKAKWYEINDIDENDRGARFVGYTEIARLIDHAPTASTEAETQSDQYKKGFEDAKRAFLIEYARESENMRKRNAQIEVMLNVQKAISADAVQEWRIGKPTEQSKYMVTLDSFGHKRIDLFYYGKPMMPNRKVRGKCWYRSDDEWGDVVYDDKDIIAWMPLPTPYKGGDDE